MPGQIVKVPFEGGIADAEELTIQQPQSLSGRLSFGEAGSLDVFVELKSIFRLLGKNGPAGEPIYLTTIQVLTKAQENAEVPAEGVNDADS